ncbi:MAG: response regulator receiver protein [Klenkia sp.]|nr:response regulator receiver protein [Klenkia sp.]
MITVLVADDHPLVRHSVVDLLHQTHDIRVVAECADGDEVLPAVLRLAPDVALLDLRMPRLSGLEATRLVRAASATRVLVLTGSWSADLGASAAAAGAAGVVLKGEDPMLLPHLVRLVAAGEPLGDARPAGTHLPRSR